ncbi:MAG: hypothetical protein KGJ93_00920 [Patescibacteria group bacterium]|nr:hypothetical protein [Patescibacteria group bacterium]
MKFLYHGDPNLNSGNKVQGKLDDQNVTIYILSREVVVERGQPVGGSHPEVVKFAVVENGNCGQMFIGLLRRGEHTIDCASGICWTAADVAKIINNKKAA